MKKEEFQALMKQVGECSNMEEARAKLIEVQQEVEKDYDDRDSVIADRDQKATEIESLRENNMKLFLQITNKEEVGKEPNKPQTKRSYTDLFNEKGGLK